MATLSPAESPTTQEINGVRLFTRKGIRRTNYSPKERWQMLGASQKEFSTYVTLFAPRRASYIRQQEAFGWTTVNHTLTDDLVVQHLLAGRIPGKRPIWIGTCAWDTTLFAAVDVDCREDAFDFVVRCNKCEEILHALGVPSSHWLVRPSPSGGRHYFFFFKRPVFVDQIAAIFEMAGLNLTPGGFEIYPTETHKFRLPFGHNPRGPHDPDAWRSFIRDYETGRIPRVNWDRCVKRAGSRARSLRQEPQHGPSTVTTQSVARRNASSGPAVPFGIPKRFLEGESDRRILQGQRIGLPAAHGTSYRLVTTRVDNGLRWHFEEAWAKGIYAEGTRYALTMKMAWHLTFAAHLAEPEIVSRLVNWVYSTGKVTSKDVQGDLRRGTREVEKQIRELVKWLVQRRGATSGGGRKRFTVSEIAGIVRAVQDLSPELTITRIRFAVDFLSFAKSTGVPSDEGWVCHPSVEGVIKKWPNCGTSNHYKNHLDWAVKKEIVKMVREKAQSIGRARTYVVMLPPTGEAVTLSFQEALDYAQLLLSPQFEHKPVLAAGHSDEYGVFVSRGGRGDSSQTSEADVEFGNGLCRKDLLRTSCQNKLNAASLTTPHSAEKDDTSEHNTADSIPASIQSNRPDHSLLSRQSVASGGTDLEQSSGDSVVAQELSLVREAAAIEKLTGPSRSVPRYLRKSRRFPATGPP